MKRKLLPSRPFIRAAKKYAKKNRASADAIKTTLELLEANAFDPQLRTHKLSGKLAGSWA
jgi:mRNA-degrading endonuclease YafQ of YafQ-DinJ toxin-antitoxin module